MAGKSHPVPECIPGADGTQVIYNNRRLLGSSPKTSIQRRLPTHSGEQTLFIFLSPLLGEGISDFVQRLPRTSAVLAIECEAPLADLWYGHAHERSRHASLQFTDNPKIATQASRVLIEDRGIRRVEVISLSGAARYHLQTYRSIESEIRTQLHQFWKNRGTEIRLGRRWVSNLWRNLLLERGTWEDLASAVPPRAVVVGAGPSLDTHIESLVEAAGTIGNPKHDRPAIVALDTALPCLAANAIPVDIVFAMDGQLANSRDLIPFRWNDAFLVADATVHPSIMRNFDPRRRFLFSTAFLKRQPIDLSSLIPPIPVLPPRGSVAPTAIEVLILLLGVTEIVTIGIDFYYRLPKTHASMSAAHRIFLTQHERRSGNDGHTAAVNRPWITHSLSDGTPVTADGVLADQALQMEHLNRSLQHDESVRIRSLGGPGLDIGTKRMGREVLFRWVTGDTLPGAGADPVYEYTPHGTYRRPIERLTHLRERLVSQERILADVSRTVFLDVELEWAWFDLPQWPAAGRRAEWAQLHRQRILRAVRDQRRRLDRALLFGGTLKNR